MLRFTRIINTIDAHAAGEPLRIVVSGFPIPRGATMLERRRQFASDHDHLRTFLMPEPRGHSGMYGCLITPPATPDGDFGVLFMHNDGYSTMCGHGIIAVTKVAVETGLISPRDPGEIKIDTPAGRVTARAHITGGGVERVSFLNVPSFVYAQAVPVTVAGVGEVRVDIAFGGAFYAFVAAAELGLQIEPASVDRLASAGMAVKRAVMDAMRVVHPVEPELEGIYGTIITDPVTTGAEGDLESRNLTIFAQAQIDRSPTGTGTAARCALLHQQGLLRDGATLRNRSVIDTVFEGRLAGTTTVGSTAAVIPEITGTAHITSLCQFVLEPDDPVARGFRITGG